MKHTPHFSQPQLPFDEVHYITLGKNAVDITNHRFGRLITLGPVGRTGKGNILWLCRCDCGNTTETRSSNLQAGHSQSCGCISREQTTLRNKTHGQSKHPLYNTWSDMNSRCHNPKSIPYPYYGKRNISVCDEWRQSPLSFYDHVSTLPHFGEPGYTLDRIDNDANYEPGNVRWATMSEQLRNTRRNVMLTHDGKTQCVSDWAEELNLRSQTLRNRLNRGWPLHKALTQLAQKRTYRTR